MVPYNSVCTQYEYQARIGMYRDARIPDPRLEALGVKFATIEEFAVDKSVVAKLSQ